jgi:hypothetical protein
MIDAESGLIVAAALIFKLSAKLERAYAPEWQTSQTWWAVHHCHSATN